MVSFQVTLNLYYDASAKQRHELEKRLRNFLCNPDCLISEPSLHIVDGDATTPQAVLYNTSIVRLDCTEANDEA